MARKGGTDKREVATSRCGGNREIAACMVGNYSIQLNRLLIFEGYFGSVSLSNHQVRYLEGHLEYHLE